VQVYRAFASGMIDQLALAAWPGAAGKGGGPGGRRAGPWLAGVGRVCSQQQQQAEDHAPPSFIRWRAASECRRLPRAQANPTSPRLPCSRSRYRKNRKGHGRGMAFHTTRGESGSRGVIPPVPGRGARGTQRRHTDHSQCSGHSPAWSLTFSFRAKGRMINEWWRRRREHTCSDRRRGDKA
jgi:hypothetical protein